MKKYFYLMLMSAILMLSCSKNGENSTPPEEDKLKKEIVGTSWINTERMIYEPPQYNNEDEWNAEVYSNDIMFFAQEGKIKCRSVMSTPNENDVAIIARLDRLKDSDYKTIYKNGQYYVILTNFEQQHLDNWYRPTNDEYEVVSGKIKRIHGDNNEYFAVYEKSGQQLKIVDCSNQYSIGITYTLGDYAFLFTE